MILIFLLSGIFAYLFFLNDWKKAVTFFLILIPFLGYIANHLKPYSQLAAIFYDFALVIPIYLLIFRKRYSFGFFGMMNFFLKYSFMVFFLLVLVQFINPFNSLQFVLKLVGLKVWLFYLPFVAVGFYYIDNEADIIKLCKTLSIAALFPCVIAIFQFILSYYIGHHETMNLFYPEEIAGHPTQEYTRFIVASNIEIFRLPSTFSSVSQLSNYLLFIFVPVMTYLNFIKNKKGRFFYLFVFILIFLASIASGVRGMYIYIPIFFIYYAIFNVKPEKAIFLGFAIYIFVFIIYSLQIGNLNLLINYIQGLTGHYASSTLEGGFDYLFNNFLGNGIGTATFQTHYITGISVKVGPSYNESYFFKVMTELGFFGIIVIFFFFLSIFNALRKTLKTQTNESIRILIASFIAFFLLTVTISFKAMPIDLFPSNILIYFFLGIILKLNQIKDNQLSKI